MNAVVQREDGRVLLHRRSDTGEWSLLSGILEPGESPAAGVVREVREEAGLRVVPERLAGVTVSLRVRHPNGDLAQYMELLFLCRLAVDGQEAHAADDETSEVGWFAMDALPAMRKSVHERLGLALAGQPEAWFTPAG
ncbi:NUDIX domain-containing protein [Streptomyces microflavus]|uniref:NUDIX domain-containing protein n=1 Tax=Streptomyces microflavus TaxID=1919 RepID=UPI0036B5C044